MRKPSTPLVSVAVPVFNGEATLAETLDSVRCQSFRDFECFIVDDGSRDGSAAIAQRYCDADPRFRLIRQANRGVAEARNTALAQARGRYFAALDADDVWHPDFLARHIEAMTAAPPGTGFTYSLARFIDGDGLVIEAVPSYPLSGRIEQCLRYCNSCGNPSVVMLDRAVALAVGGYDPRLRAAGCEGAEDWLLLMKMAANGPALAIPLYLSGYRQMAGSMSANRSRMLRSSALGESLFSAEPGRDAVSSATSRWQRSARQLQQARSAARRGRILSFARRSIGALLLDPARTLAMIADIPLRAMAVRHRRDRPAFAALDPADRFANFTDSHPFKARLMQRRLRRLVRR